MQVFTFSRLKKNVILCTAYYYKNAGSIKLDNIHFIGVTTLLKHAGALWRARIALHFAPLYPVSLINSGVSTN